MSQYHSIKISLSCSVERLVMIESEAVMSTSCFRFLPLLLYAWNLRELMSMDQEAYEENNEMKVPRAHQTTG